LPVSPAPPCINFSILQALTAQLEAAHAAADAARREAAEQACRAEACKAEVTRRCAEQARAEAERTASEAAGAAALAAAKAGAAALHERAAIAEAGWARAMEGERAAGEDACRREEAAQRGWEGKAALLRDEAAAARRDAADSAAAAQKLEAQLRRLRRQRRGQRAMAGFLGAGGLFAQPEPLGQTPTSWHEAAPPAAASAICCLGTQQKMRLQGVLLPPHPHQGQSCTRVRLGSRACSHHARPPGAAVPAHVAAVTPACREGSGWGPISCSEIVLADNPKLPQQRGPCQRDSLEEIAADAGCTLPACARRRTRGGGGDGS
jgi:hypothetical protein